MTNNAPPSAHSLSDLTYKIRALTPIWTGDYRRRGGRLIPTGLLGSLRWWYEVLVRGLGGYACDPSAEQKECKGTDHCVVCELFGCTGWARKFAFAVLDRNGQIQQKQIAANSIFQLRFTELRPIKPEEWTLLDATLRLIAHYGAIGGKTVLKPTDEPDPEDKDERQRKELRHKDYGLIKIECPLSFSKCSRNDLESYLKEKEWRKADHDDFAWASLKNFWFVNKKYLARKDAEHSTFNRVVGREESKDRSQFLSENNKINRWLSGWRPVGRRNAANQEQQNESKKVFSFKNPARTFGFVKPGLIEFKDIKKRLKDAWSDFSDDKFQVGEQILNELLP